MKNWKFQFPFECIVVVSTTHTFSHANPLVRSQGIRATVHTLCIYVSTFSDGYLSIEYRADAAFQSQGPESELNKPPATCMLTKLDSDKSRLDLDSERKVAETIHPTRCQRDGP